jgi:kinesin family protein 6/9
VHVKGLLTPVVRNEEEALNYLFDGETKKTLASTRMNDLSSRAHSVYTIHIQSKPTLQSADKVIHSQLHLVDLAGNERTKKLDHQERVKEANYINRSLSFLEQVVVASCDSKKDHVPYRQSKLTNLLKNSIGGNCCTVLIANVWPEKKYLEETISTLRFASRMMKVQNEAKVNRLNDPILHLKKLQREVRDLKQEL